MFKRLLLTFLSVILFSITACSGKPSLNAETVNLTKPEPTRLEFQAEDGRTLVGYYYPSWMEHAPIVVLMHMIGLTQKDWVILGLVDWLQNWPSYSEQASFAMQQTGIYPPMPAGLSFAVMTFDFRGFGESLPEMPNPDSLSVDERDQWFDGWRLDSEAAYETAKSLPSIDPNRIAGIGASIGADGVVNGCSEGCLGALSFSPDSYLRVPYDEAVRVLNKADKPVWCIAHEKDAESAETCQSAGGAHYRMILYSDAPINHGMEFLFPSSAPADLGQVILDWLLLTYNFSQ